jgi:hypothetical protein
MEIIWESCVFMLVVHRICLFSVGLYYNSTLILWILHGKLCMTIGARPHVCGVL